MRIVLVSGALSSVMNDIRVWPVESRAPQRRIEATQSAPMTGVPSSPFQASVAQGLNV
jgi:hypothetical protein